MADTPFATDTFYRVLQKQRRDHELTLPTFDQAYQRAYPKTLTRGEEIERISGEPVPLALEMGSRHERQ